MTMNRKIISELKSLIDEAAGLAALAAGSGASEITSVEYDSRKAGPGSLFVAIEGFESDGHRFCEQAVEAGAAAVCVSSNRLDEFRRLADKGAAVITTDNGRAALSRLSAAFHGYPSRDMGVVGITGTNGKTSITFMVESILKQAGRNPGVIGTVNYRWGGKYFPAANTTPESSDIHRMLGEMLDEGVDTALMEVSSHALELSRADDIDFNVAVFTNLTRDHLDFHGEFDSYFNSKKRLFSILEKSAKADRAAVINSDDSYGRKLIDGGKFPYPVKGFGLTSGEYRPVEGSVKNLITGVDYHVERNGRAMPVNLALAGSFHVYNSLAAIAVADCLGIDEDAIIEGLKALRAVPGRFDVVESPEGYHVVIDYAHTSDALEKLLLSVNELDHNRVITVFGCGGDRDKTKRPVMGAIAASNSDIAIVTSDNPRTEDPEAIIKDVTAGIEGNSCRVVVNREEAIREAISLSEKGDIVVIAGKGHEDYQIIGREKIHFDDHEIAERYIRERKK